MHTYMYVHIANVIKGAGSTIGIGNKNTISPMGEFGITRLGLQAMLVEV